MSALKRKTGEQRREFAVADAASIKVAGEGSTATPSPALELQNALSLAFAPEPVVQKWPRSLRMALFVGGAVVPWAIIGLSTMLVSGALR